MALSINKNLTQASIILAALVAAVFLQTGWHDFICFDDSSYIYNNAAIKNGFSTDSLKWAFSTFYQYNWHPLTWLSHLADTTLFGLNPAGHHLHSAALHCASTILLFLALARATGEPGKSFVVAALFAIHPLRAESVAWAAERKDVLSVFFGFAAIYTYILFTKNKTLSSYLTAIFLYSASLMSKPTLVTLPLILLLLDWLQLNYRQIHHTTFLAMAKEKIPFLILATVSSVITIIAQYKGGAVATLQSVPILLRLGNAVISYWRYIFKTIIPTELSVFYLRDQSLSIPLSIIAGVFLLITTFLLLRYSRQIPALIFGWLWFLLTLLPMSGIVQVGNQAMADRYSYIPTIGLLVVLAWSAEQLCNKIDVKPVMRIAGACIIIITYSVIGWQQTALWRNGKSLFNNALKLNPENYVVLILMGDQLRENNSFQEAIPYYRKALQISPNMHLTHNNIAICLTQTGNFHEARKHLSLSLMLNPESPDTLFNMGMVLGKLNLHEEAAASLYRFIQRVPRDAEAHFFLAESIRLAGRLNDAVSHYETALSIDPTLVKAAQRLEEISKN